jgi:hypothetical protein
MLTAPQHIITQASTAIEQYVNSLGLADVVSSSLYVGSGDVRSHAEVNFLITDVVPAMEISIAIYTPTDITMTCRAHDSALCDITSYDSIAKAKAGILDLACNL